MAEIGEFSPSSERSDRKPHAVLDLPSRHLKALKIERLLDLDRRPGQIRLLEVGTGSGGIAHYFATHASGRFIVDAVDVVDNRLVCDGYRYATVIDATLPFQDGSFDVVVSNHVIEHVGDQSQQLFHLSEVRRVMSADAVGYLAVPNRWMRVEPHYQLAYLSWLPRRLRSPYLRLRGKGDIYDCEPLEMRQLESMLCREGFAFQNLCVEAMRATIAIERPGTPPDRWLKRIPNSFLKPFRSLIPTLIYQICRARS